METLQPRDLLLAGALLVGIGFGVVGRLSGFCFRSALVEIARRGPGRQCAAWIAAITAAVLGTQALAALQLIQLSDSIYLGTKLAWGTLVLGGGVFGAGMVLSRGCGARHLVLLAGGNLRSLVVLTSLGLSAYATLRGILALPRSWLVESASVELDTSGQSVPALVAAGLDVDLQSALWVVLSTLILISLVLLSRTRWREPVVPALASGAVIGLLVPAGWYVTGVLGFDEFEPTRLESLTFTAPVGNAIQYLLTYTGASADFGIAAVGGVLIGAFTIALIIRDLHGEGFDELGPLVRYIAGGLMMGFGGVLALGCTVGAGLTGLSTLSLGSVLAVAAIAAGAALALRVTRVMDPTPAGLSNRRTGSARPETIELTH